MATKNRMGPMIRPSMARDAPMVANRGARQNWARESPIPARGPIRAILMLRISLDGVLFSSITRCRLVMNGRKWMLVLKNSMFSFNASWSLSSSSLYILRREGYSTLAYPRPW